MALRLYFSVYHGFKLWQYMAVHRPLLRRHLESWPPGINVYRHVWTMYVQCMYNASVQRLTDMVYTIIEKHKHVHTCMYISVNVYTCMYMVCTCLACSTWYVQVVVWTCTYIVQTCMSRYIMMFIHWCTRFQSYKRVCTMYKPGCQGFVYLMLNVQKAAYIL